jgi:subtilisin family serine protease
LELFAVWKDGIATAIRSAPQTLFVVAGGNSNSSTSFQEEVPASLHMPNVLAVGAVDRSGEETTFTSYGETVLVDADGQDVESYVPGGTRLKLSGTSMAAPAVTNLAAKLFALDPSLTPEQAIALIREGASTSPDGRRHLIDPKQSIALLKASSKK